MGFNSAFKGLMTGVLFIKEWWETRITDRQLHNTGHAKLESYPLCNATLNELCYLDILHYIQRYQEMQLSMLLILRKSYSVQLKAKSVHLRCCTTTAHAAEHCYVTRYLKKSSLHSWFQTFAVFWMLYAFFWVIPRRLNSALRSFGTLCSIFIGG